MRAAPLVDGITCSLGEGPTWDAQAGVAHVVDIDAGTLWELDLGSTPPARQVLRCGTTLGAAVHADGGGFLLAAGGGLRWVDADGDVAEVVDLVPPGVASRLNDGSTDPAGRYVVGSLALDERTGAERLWRLEQDGTVTVLDDDLTLSNGLGWSPDGTLFYSVDSVPGVVWVRDYDPSGTGVGTRHRLLAIEDGTPDGLTVDADGNLWIAIWGAGEVRGYDATGKAVEVIEVGPPHTTSCAFVGPDLRTMLVTTAGKTVDGVEPTPRCGQLFTVELPVRGRAINGWRPVG